MISVSQATSIISSHTIDFGTEDVPLDECFRRILRENIYADTDLPPYDRVAMDGIAINFDSYSKGLRTFTISAMAAAGSPQQKTLLNDADCIEIMTGTILPHNTDTVIPYEWLSIADGKATLIKDNVIEGQNIHRKGTDKKKGNLLIQKGKIISASEIGILASVGKTSVIVSKLPKVLIVSTGDELVEVNETPLPHQIRMSNVYQLHYALQKFLINADRMHLKDDYTSILKNFQSKIKDYNIIIISGGISAGKFDHIPDALEASGVQKHFYKVEQKPGKPFWFGTHPDGCIVFGIPGNPVSSFLCYIRYIQPFIEQCLKKNKRNQIIAKLSEGLHIKSTLTNFITVRLEQNENAELIAIPIKGHGSGDFSVLTDSDAFLELPAGKELFLEGDHYNVYNFK